MCYILLKYWIIYLKEKEKNGKYRTGKLRTLMGNTKALKNYVSECTADFLGKKDGELCEVEGNWRKETWVACYFNSWYKLFALNLIWEI